MKFFSCCSTEPTGEIRIDTEKPMYTAGETVRGNVYLSLHKPEKCNAVKISVTGKEYRARCILCKEKELSENL